MLGGAAHGFYEAADYFWIELVGGAAFQFGEGFLGIASFFVGTLGSDGVVGVGDGDDAGAEGNLIGGEAVGIAGAIVKFVMVANHFTDSMHGGERLKNFCAELGVGFHGDPFGGVEWAGLIQNGFGNADFADVVQQTGETDFLYFGLVHAQGLRDHHRIRGDFLRVTLGVAVFRVNSERERSDRVHNRGRNGIAGIAIAVFDE